MDLKETQLLATVPSVVEVIEITVAFVQLYRESAKYLDRPYKWIAKVGLDWVIARVVADTFERAALVARFDHSQSIFQRDPWAERTAAAEREVFAPLADLRVAEAAE
jgi:nitrite reductase (NADH) large subunit